LNVSPSAVRNLHMDNEAASFDGRFGGVSHTLFVPTGAILGIYARENGQGMVFDLESPELDEEDAEFEDIVESDDDAPPPGSPPPRPSGRPSLKVVK